MMANGKYRNVGYGIDLRGSDRWVWSFHLKPGLGKSGMATGSYADAERACKRAIDVFLRDRITENTSGTLTAKIHGEDTPLQKTSGQEPDRI